ncbi:MAG: hypothetical protein DI555_07155 [Novosphingobium pentaromativorans]|uniref:MarR family transcriptional regulator n=1 Tax=Novosphingobium pentaromativorans TaxID=205844 RepID=A0A2W5QDZ0_9SPHN|nr:MAG: hypothetical protein DI555_07155 [Novosphingobium pentaromativorans]
MTMPETTQSDLVEDIKTEILALIDRYAGVCPTEIRRQMDVKHGRDNVTEAVQQLIERGVCMVDTINGAVLLVRGDAEAV